MADKRIPVSPKLFRILAFTIKRFYKRPPEIKRRMKALDWNRHDRHIYHKVVEWFEVIGEQLSDPAILPENVYNMDETGVLLSVLNSIKVLVGMDDLRNYRGTCVKRTTGYTDSVISLYWIQRVFDPLTKSRANNKPRSLEAMKFCYENNILLCRLPSHTSHKLQPCDVGLFGPSKTAYREQVERMYRGGAGTIGKEHFTALYSRARDMAFTARNIRCAWSKTGLYPFNPDKGLKEIQKLQTKYSNPLSITTRAKPAPKDELIFF
ncbi:DDE-domain-containing protein [Zopfia rhizophila CBS 207.26]|uniref:DDE-domain-containing protein n=1 Tax=Zopfia rhizophila CBS 207.26 TaxID=1314779 RepID=A0A6A6DMH8_9PEZI|nr:DDE-domain-containing protein [Zopfia rhizophila CBS 207.26]